MDITIHITDGMTITITPALATTYTTDAVSVVVGTLVISVTGKLAVHNIAMREQIGAATRVTATDITVIGVRPAARTGANTDVPSADRTVVRRGA